MSVVLSWLVGIPVRHVHSVVWAIASGSLPGGLTLGANGLVTDVMQRGCRYSGAHDLKQAFRTRHLCFAHTAYLQAIDFALRSGVGSRGSAIVLDRSGAPIHDLLDATWRILPEDSGFRAKILETELKPDGSVCSAWTDSRPVPETGSWFETTWADYREGKIYTSQ